MTRPDKAANRRTRGQDMAETMTKARMHQIQREPKNPVLRFHSCTCGAAPGAKPEHQTTEPLRRTEKGYRCTRCGREA